MVHAVKVAAAALSIGARMGSHVARQTAVCPLQPTCPADNGCLSTQPNGDVFQIACATDYVGNDIQTVQTGSYSDCLYACSTTQGCVAVSYTNGFCYLKNGVNPAPANNTAIAAATLLSPPHATPTPSPILFCPANLITCPANSNCIFAAGPAGLRQKPYVVACDTDFYGGDLSNQGAASAGACVNACALVGQCVAVSYVAETKVCYLKSRVGRGVFKRGVTGAYARGVVPGA